MSITITRRLAAAGVAAAALLLAGCSGGTDEVNGGTPAGSGAPTTAPATPPASTTAAAPTSGGDPLSPPNCPTASLRITLGDGDAGAGSSYRPLIFTNTGGSTCQLRGFPGVSYVSGDDGHQVGPAAAMSGERGGEVRLAPGGSAAAQLQLVDVQNFDAATCRPTPVRGLRVYPPGNTQSAFVPFETTGCAAEQLPGNQLSVQTMTAR
ncbi:DUF4232 domain-containing protein [Pseudonocardia halophobica]|uniref:DUF4232 domain-containing protein n=1 Tax=Pseudonocardia halophobica TaxID=29401 RepID=A0A9W6L4V2_9PSEU|nr:DUF4232 domain-containing protein [Pseudonocardia halophobica]GLL11124.1 hypothetical protein GCM10017577_22650 [Pseudonocardia halophobica]